MAKKAVGLYIGNNVIDVVELLKKGLGKPILVNCGRVTISPEAGEEPDDKKVITAIQRVLTENNIKTKEVITALPEEEVIIRYFKMPRLSKKERDAGIRFEAKKYIPFKLEELVSDFYVLEPKKSSKQMEVIFVAARKKAVEQHVSVLTQAGLKPVIIESPSFSLTRIFSLTHDIKKEETTVIINVNIDSTTISILKDNLIYLTRSVRMGEKKTEEGEKGTEFENLVSELHLSFDYYKKQFPGGGIGRIILYGEGRLEGWDNLLSQELKIPVVIGDPRKGIAGSGKMSSKMAEACGLALGGLVRPAVKINLVIKKGVLAAPIPLMAKETAEKILFGELIAAAFLLLLLHIAMTMQIKKTENRLNGVIALRPEVKMELAVDSMSPEQLEKVERDLYQKRAFLAALIDKRIYWTEKLSRLAELFPEGTWIKSIVMSDTIGKGNNIVRSLVIEGSAFSKDAKQERRLVNTVAGNIRKDELFNKGVQNINLAFIKKGMEGKVEVTEFKLVCSSGGYTPR